MPKTDLSLDDIIQLNKYFLGKLNKREQDIIARRFGLKKSNKDTLEKIGRDHKLTRERVRQLQASALKKIKELKELEEKTANIKKIIFQVLAEYGGLAERDHLLESLIALLKKQESQKLPEKKKIEHSIYKNNFYFLISKILDELEEVEKSPKLKNYLKLQKQDIKHLEEIGEEITEKIKNHNKPLKTAEVVNLFKSLESYNRHKDKLAHPDQLDLSKVLNILSLEEDADFIHNHRIFYSILKALREIEQNKLGYWGNQNWSEIKPKTISEKIYLILRENGKPMHFTEIAKKINDIGFDKKIANPATVHNELILGEKYVLIGRGIYSLTDWGYKKGTVNEIIKELLASGPLEKETIIKEVLKQRLVKVNTILLSLSSDYFKKDGNKYSLAN